jgi:hypothetical protein
VPQDNVPLNFFSWHCYTADPTELVARSRAVRRLLDDKGFTETENHLNEWNYLPGNTWEPIGKSATPADRQRFYGEMGGAQGAAFVAAALLELRTRRSTSATSSTASWAGSGSSPSRASRSRRTRPSARSADSSRPAARRGPRSRRGQARVRRRPERRRSGGFLPRQQLRRPAIGGRAEVEGFAWTGGVTAEIRTIDDGSDFSTPGANRSRARTARCA